MTDQTPPVPPQRIGDRDRDQVIARLRAAVGEGRLTLDEFADRVGDVYAATTREQLLPAIADLPMPARAPVVPEVEGRPPRPTRRQWLVAIMSGSKRRGRWRVSEKVTAFAFWGGVTLDFRGAVIESSEIDVTAWAIMGGVVIIVPEGIPVELDGFMLMGGHEDRTRGDVDLPGAPVIRVHGYGMWGGVTITSRPHRSQDSDEFPPGNPGYNRNAGYDRGHGRNRDDYARQREEYRRQREEFRRQRGGHRQGNQPPPQPLPHDTGGRVPPMPQIPMPSVQHLPQMPPPPPRPPPPPSAAPAAPAPAAKPAPAAAAPTPKPRAPEPAPEPEATEPVEAEPATSPDTYPQAPAGSPIPRGTVTIVFTDLVASTELADRLGDQRWLGVLNAHNALVREQIGRHQGTEVKSQGDGFLVVFTSARDGLRCAIDIQRALASYCKGHPDTPLQTRVGVHTGEVVEHDGDVYGRNVILASRIAEAAGPGEILTSALTKQLADSGGDLGFGEARTVDLKGLAGSWEIHRVDWI